MLYCSYRLYNNFITENYEVKLHLPQRTYMEQFEDITSTESMAFIKDINQTVNYIAILIIIYIHSI